MLYSSLSQLTRQAFLMQSELPTLLNMFDIDYQLEYSESFSGTVGQKCAIVWWPRRDTTLNKK